MKSLYDEDKVVPPPPRKSWFTGTRIAIIVGLGSLFILDKVTPSSPDKAPPEGEFTLDWIDTRAVKDGVRLGLKDPDSAQFGTMRASRSNGAVTVCGLVNAKNSFGGFTGERVFAGALQNNGQFIMTAIGEDTPGIRAVTAICQNAKLLQNSTF